MIEMPIKWLRNFREDNEKQRKGVSALQNLWEKKRREYTKIEQKAFMGELLAISEKVNMPTWVKY